LERTAADRSQDPPAASELTEVPFRLSDVPVEYVDPARLSRVTFFTDPRGAGADRFRFLRLRLLELQTPKDLRRFLITSPLSQDGKSTVALNLVTALAEGGKRSVLLIEADLHHSALSRQLGLERRPGLAECLKEQLNPLSAVRRVDPLACYFLPAGETSDNPSELLQSAVLHEAMGVLSAQFDWIVVDAPPVAPLTDVLSLRKEVDATLLVVRAGVTPADAVEEALALLGPKHVVSIILNGVENVERLYSKYYRAKS
jgi:capsular exopolysaccharide synthesis family protein